ncbi:ATP-dependent permease [Vanrija albida]|uniref:ATP-dependent permease n=1 Tax=Vanrija albida TaxID=181172 RepID=A0ABR3Q905_9TREE
MPTDDDVGTATPRASASRASSIKGAMDTIAQAASSISSKATIKIRRKPVPVVSPQSADPPPLPTGRDSALGEIDEQDPFANLNSPWAGSVDTFYGNAGVLGSPAVRESWGLAPAAGVPSAASSARFDPEARSGRVNLDTSSGRVEPDTSSSHGLLEATSAKIDLDNGHEKTPDPVVDAIDTANPRRSIYPPAGFNVLPTPETYPPRPSAPSPTARQPPAPVPPRFRYFFTYAPRRLILTALLPALVFSVAASLVQPYMTIVIGEAFGALQRYPPGPPLTPPQTPEQKHRLVTDVGTASLKLLITGIAAWILEYLKTAAWYYFGEGLTDHLRRLVFDGVQRKPMAWFDVGMGMQSDEGVKLEEGANVAVGMGGLMAKFTRETDDVRIATITGMGKTVQSIITFLLCLGLSLYKSPKLAIVTLSAVPLIMGINVLARAVCHPLYAVERRGFAEASTDIERATAAIATVKVHNAQVTELERFRRPIANARDSLFKQGFVWGACFGSTNVLIFTIFVAGFWYGAKLVNDGQASVENVMTVFWACLMATGALQGGLQPLSYITKGTMSLASLLTVIQDDETLPTPGPENGHGVVPARCQGSFDLHDVYFAYPSRPDDNVLSGVTLFLPAGEMTFVVGGSGSGKSTIAQLLLRLYAPDFGNIVLDDTDFETLDTAFTGQRIAAVQQGCILFDMSVHDNVAMGMVGSEADELGRTRTPADVSRAEVIEACRLADIHDFIVSLPEGYETRLGTGGSQLSGGQRQRLAIARARIRDPTVLILDEATSALDVTSRVAVFDAIKGWRKNQTTIVITHDLSQIGPDDFVYVMHHGVVAEQGFRFDLMLQDGRDDTPVGVFAALAAAQNAAPLPPKEVAPWHDASALPEDAVVLRAPRPDYIPTWARPTTMMEVEGEYEVHYNDPLKVFRDTVGAPLLARRLSLGNRRSMNVSEEKAGALRRSLSMGNKRSSMSMDHKRSLSTDHQPSTSMDDKEMDDNPERPPTAHSDRKVSLSPDLTRAQRRLTWSEQELGNGPFHQRASVASAAKRSSGNYHYVLKRTTRDLRDSAKHAHLDLNPGSVAAPSTAHHRRGLAATIAWYYPSIPHKTAMFVGLLTAVLQGAQTPIWSFFISKLMTLIGAPDAAAQLPKIGGTLIGLSVSGGLFLFLQEYILQGVAAMWTAKIRTEAYERVLAQDKGWFDDPDHSPAALVQHLVKDVDDMRHLVATLLPKTVVVVMMMGLGLIWAMVAGWQLTLVGLALTPLFVAMFAGTEGILSRTEIHNKSRRENVARAFYESVANIRGIRAMGLESSFHTKFTEHADDARKSGQDAAWLNGIGLGVAVAIPIFAQAVMNYVGAVFIKQAVMSYATMLQVYTLVLFSLTFGAQILSFIPFVAKTKAAAHDFGHLFTLSTTTQESTGIHPFPAGTDIAFDGVAFRYPTRPDVSVLYGLDLSIKAGECVAIVGQSGSGKTTTAALLQRLYEPASGTITLGGVDLGSIKAAWLRAHIAVVSQTASLFDATVAENIAYGSKDVTREDLVAACEQANIHEFILSLPRGYDTNLGENAALISGGQAQRLQIARALVRKSRILILDECTSALDIENQRAVLDTILRVRGTTIFITHSLEVMRHCDRVICLGDGQVAEQGPFAELIARGGVFARLTRTGEWE